MTSITEMKEVTGFRVLISAEDARAFYLWFSSEAWLTDKNGDTKGHAAALADTMPKWLQDLARAYARAYQASAYQAYRS